MKLILCFIMFFNSVNSYHILCVTTVPSKSHSSLGKGIAKSLLKAGHEVTWVTPYPDLMKPTEGLKIVNVSEVLLIVNATYIPEYSPMNRMKNILNVARKISVEAMIPTLQKILRVTKFDAVVTELFYFNDFEAGYAAILEVPWIAVTCWYLEPYSQSRMDEVNSLPGMTMTSTEHQPPINIWQRLNNVAIFLKMKNMQWQEETANEIAYEKMFKPLAEAKGKSLPPLSKIANNISILFVNSHPSFTDAISLPPNVVEVAGFHIDEEIPPLPEDLQKLLDSSPHGVVYFSMGSYVKASIIPEHVIEKILEVFDSLPQTVIWVYDRKLKGFPPNVHIRKWAPQTAILAHPNLQAFITHGGMLSQIEGVSAGVPMVCMPLFGDQLSNCRRAEKLGYAIQISFDFETLATQIQQALTQILGSEKYMKRSKELSRLFKNRPVPPSKLISHYIQLAIESKGAVHLRSKSLLYTWYQRWMLDLLAIIIIAIYVVFMVLKKAIITLEVLEKNKLKIT